MQENNNLIEKLPVVAIGASAGGLEAMTQLLRYLPHDTGMAYVYVQHLDPTHESNLAEILGRATKMKVTETVQHVELEANHLYIIPPNKEMVLTEGSIVLEDRPPAKYAHMPINRFFSSLSDKFEETIIGVILSGAANDGTIGLKAIKLAGGLTFAQDESATFQSMPKSAIADGAVDLVMSPKEIAEELARISKQQELYYSAISDGHEAVAAGDEELTGILLHLYKVIGVDFRQYKMSTIRRRVARRMMLQNLESLKEYGQFLKKNLKEQNLLYQDLLINVTTFFRDKGVTEYLKSSLFPSIIETKPPDEPFRIWVPACATGQEVYSLAMLLFDILGTKAASTPIQIFATDLSEPAINKARLGVFSKTDLEDVPQSYIENYFTKVDGHYRIIKAIRDVCIFATHNIAKDPPFSRLDLISCCNLLIYLDNPLQKKVLNTFHYSLNSNGYLILGQSEAIGNSGHLFALVDKRLKVYMKKKDAIAKTVFELNYRLPRIEGRPLIGSKGVMADQRREGELLLERSVDQLLLKRFTPASVVVNADLDILQFRGSIGMFLEPAPGKASLNLLKMARAGLGFELRNVVHKAKKTGESAKKDGLEILFDGKKILISIEAVPLRSAEIEDEYYVVVFEEMQPVLYSDESAASDMRAKQLESELTALRDDMRSIIEVQEAANEELQSANEEIVSSNEELQSINEELETSKEEIESSNEELITINQELQQRNEQLTEMQEYSDSLFSIARESMLILDKDLRVKNANKTFYRTFNVKEEETLGRLLRELGNNQWNIPKLRELLDSVMVTNTPIENFIVTHQFEVIGEKVMCLNAAKISQTVYNNHMILLVIEDITEITRLRKRLAEIESKDGSK